MSEFMKRAFSPSWVVLVDMGKVGAEIESAMEGNTAIVLQLDVDLACEETFYVTDGENGNVRSLSGRRYCDFCTYVGITRR